MHNVSRFEASLLRLLYYFLPPARAGGNAPLPSGRGPLRAALLSQPRRRSSGAGRPRQGLYLSPRPARRVARRAPPAQRTRRRWPALAAHRAGKARPEFFAAVSRIPHGGSRPPGPATSSPHWQPDHNELTHGDLLLRFFAHEGLRDTVEGLGAPGLRKRGPYMHHGLCWLAYPEDFTQVPDSVRPEFRPLDRRRRPPVSWKRSSPELLARWIHVEERQGANRATRLDRGVGGAQDRVLDAFLTAVERLAGATLHVSCFAPQAGCSDRTPIPACGPALCRWAGSAWRIGRPPIRPPPPRCCWHMDRLAGWTRWARSWRLFRRRL